MRNDPSMRVEAALRPKLTWASSIGCAVFWLAALVLLLMPPIMDRRPGPKAQCTNNLRQILLALRAYDATHGVYPPVYTCDAAGKRLHSWRTLLLPHLEGNALYDSIDLTKPWDDPVNAKARREWPSIYRCPSAGSTPRCLYMAFVSGPAPSNGEPPLVGAGGSQLMLVECPLDRAIHWMEPVDADEALLLSLNSQTKCAHSGGFNVALTDTSVYFFSVDSSHKDVRRLIEGVGTETRGGTP